MTDRPPSPDQRRPLRRAAAALAAAGALAAVVGCSGDDGASAPTTTGTTAPAPTTTTTEAPTEAGERVYVYEPQVGDCFDRRTLESEEGGERIVLLLDCALPHQFEVFAVAEIDEAALPPPLVTTTTTAPPPPPPTEVDPEGNPVEAGPPEGTPDEAEATTTTSTTAPPAPGWPGQEVLERFARRVCPPPFDAWVGVPYELSELEISWVLPEEQDWLEGERTMACTIYDPATERLSGTTAGIAR